MILDKKDRANLATCEPDHEVHQNPYGLPVNCRRLHNGVRQSRENFDSEAVVRIGRKAIRVRR